MLRSIGCDTLAERQMFPPASGLTIPMMPIWLKLGLDKAAPTSLTHRFQFVRDSDRALVTINGAKTGTADPTSVVTNEGRSHAVSPTRQVTERLLDLGAVVTFGP